MDHRAWTQAARINLARHAVLRSVGWQSLAAGGPDFARLHFESESLGQGGRSGEEIPRVPPPASRPPGRAGDHAGGPLDFAGWFSGCRSVRKGLAGHRIRRVAMFLVWRKDDGDWE